MAQWWRGPGLNQPSLPNKTPSRLDWNLKTVVNSLLFSTNVDIHVLSPAVPRGLGAVSNLVLWLLEEWGPRAWGRKAPERRLVTEQLDGIWTGKEEHKDYSTPAF